MSRSILAAFLAVLVGTCTGASGQTIRYVDDDAAAGGDGLSWGTAYNDLHDALTTAQSGDQIWVAAGRYIGNFTLKLGVEMYGGFAGTDTELSQRDWKANETILDGNQTGSVVTSPAGATATTRIDGFTITNGNASFGGGLYLSYSSPTIANNTITGNSAWSAGGGLYLYESSPTIADNTVTGNRAAYYYGGGGGGGGLCLWSSSPTITNNTITGNSARRGGGLYLHESSARVGNNTIAGNSAVLTGGGLYLQSSCPMITNNTITGNSADYYSGGGGGLYLSSSAPTITNTIVAFNLSGVSRYSSTGTPTFRYNCVYGNTAYDYDGLANPTGTAGNISAHPLFLRNPGPGPDRLWGTHDDDSVGDLHLQGGSPCINTGDPDFVPAAGETDLDGHARVLCDRVDMGAYEFGIGDYDCNRSVQLPDFAAWNACMTGPDAGPYATDCVPFDFDFDGDVDLSDAAGFMAAFTGPP